MCKTKPCARCGTETKNNKYCSIKCANASIGEAAGFKLETLLIENSTFQRTNLKRKLLRSGVLKNECSECGMGPEWNGKPLVMVLDHKNGIHNDDRIENLRLLCPNCNSQTETFAGRRKPYKVEAGSGFEPLSTGSEPVILDR